MSLDYVAERVGYGAEYIRYCLSFKKTATEASINTTTKTEFY